MANPIAAMGSQGLKTARLGYGCMSLSENFYGPTGLSEEDAGALLLKAHALGVRLFNTSDLYGPYTNETLLGKALEPVKSEIVIATKWGPMIIPGKGFVMDASRANCRKTCEEQLVRLRVPSIQLWTMRGPCDLKVPLEETMQEVKALVAEGKVQYVGLSEVTADDIRRAHAITPISAVELEWSLFTRDVERDLIPTCRELGIGIMAYSPIGRGLLTGTIKNVDSMLPGDMRKHGPRFQEGLVKNLTLVDRVTELAKKKGCTTVQLALAWLMAKGPGAGWRGQ
ncbi:MAG: hypothetical protein WDW38_009259 [Sanguina aurantia]